MMMLRKKRATGMRMLTEVELELMTAIWGLGECTVKEVQGALPKGRDLAYTSVATMMKIMAQKKFLGSRKGEKAHVYFPQLSRGEYEAASLRHLTENVFQGDPSNMVMRLLDDSRLTSEELQKIRKLLEERAKAR